MPETSTDRPVCACHGLPMWRDQNGDGWRGWRCAEKKRLQNAASHKRHAETRNEKNREWFAGLTGPAYSLRSLQMRRANGLARKRARQLRRETEGAD